MMVMTTMMMMVMMVMMMLMVVYNDGDDCGGDGPYGVTGQSLVGLWDDDNIGVLGEIMICDETLFCIS